MTGIEWAVLILSGVICANEYKFNKRIQEIQEENTRLKNRINAIERKIEKNNVL